MTPFPRYLASWLVLFLIVARGTYSIANGKTVFDSAEFPFTATFLTPALCGGAFISLDPPWLLTAAHCLEGYGTHPNASPNKDAIGYGNVHILRQKRASIARAIPHPRYERIHKNNGSSPQLMQYDIGLVQLAQPVEPSPFVDRIALWPGPNETTDPEYFIPGMGYTSLNGPQAERLQTAQCTRAHPLLPAIEEVKDNVITTVSSSALCHGDSGSALVAQQENAFYLVGVLDRILDVHDPDQTDPTCPVLDRDDAPAYNVFANAALHLEWIVNVTHLPVERLTTPPFTHAGSRVGYDVSFAPSITIRGMLSLGSMLFCCMIVILL